MKTLRILVITIFVSMSLSSCSVWSNVFKRKSGCPTNGKNVGAEKLLSGDQQSQKAARKAAKFKS
ncbi:MAG TPA: hypothetical protein VIQ00_17060 [Chitinophagaceae bacterium]|jgi:hypothetical protein